MKGIKITNYFKEVTVLFRNLRSWALAFIVLAFWFFAVPLPGSQPASVWIIKKLKQDFLTSSVKLVVINPFDAFVSQVSASIFLAFTISFPLLLLGLFNFLFPAFYPHERKFVVKILIPSTLLFIAGFLFAYTLITPFLIEFLYAFADLLGAQALINIKDLAGFVLSLSTIAGLMFQLPLLMYGFRLFRLVDRYFWRRFWKHALIAILIVTGIITPDGSGVTMLLLTIPMLVLYGIGVFISKKLD